MAARRSGFTLVELLVVMSIIAALMGLLLPAIQAARETARRSQCLTRVQQFAYATQQFESARGYYPGYYNKVGSNNTSFMVTLMPYLEHSDLYAGWADTANTSTTSLAQFAPYIQIAECPSNPASSTDNRPISYVANSGIADVSTPNALLAAAGVFQNRVGTASYTVVKVNSDYVSSNDGLGTTLMFSENLLPMQTWYDAATALTPERARILTTMTWYHTAPSGTSHTINGDKKNAPTTTEPTDLTWSRPSSQHPGGVNVSFCDGHTKFIAEEIVYGVYKQLMTPNGRFVVRAISGGDVGNDTPLDESQY